MVWRDHVSINPGDSWVGSIFKGIENADFVVPLLSINALKSRWVKKEIETALIKSLSKEKKLSIIPAKLEPIEIPTELVSLQSINFYKRFNEGLDELINAIEQKDFFKQNNVVDETTAPFAQTLSKISRSFLNYFKTVKKLDELPRKQLLILHKNLIKLQAVVEEIATLSERDSKELSDSMEQILSSPISGAEDVSNSGFLASFKQRSNKENNSGYRIALVSRYISIMGEIIKSIRSSALSSLPISDPRHADALMHLFQSKVSIYQKLKSYNASDNGLKDIIETNKEIIDYIEATRTLEAKTLLQLIDADARELTKNEQSGLSVFEEITQNKVQVLEQIVFLRRSIGALITS
jgi:hypothetical protein